MRSNQEFKDDAMSRDNEPSPEESSELDVIKSRLLEAERQLRGTAINQALWQIETVLDHESAKCSPQVLNSLRKAAEHLEKSTEVASLRELQSARDQLANRGSTTGKI
jgi:hypothetical protein